MRLIDATKWGEFYQEMTKDLKPYDHYDDGFRDAMDNADDWMDGNQVEAEPVRHGRWEDKPTGAYGRYQSWCTACGKHSGIGGIESNRHKPYCPNCGARMDADSDTIK